MVVGGRNVHEAHAAIAQGLHRGDDVVGAQGDVLHAGTVVVLDVLLDLGLLAPLGGLVQGHDDLRAVPHHGRHQGRVLGADLVVVEVDELGEAHHVGVEVDPRVELALLDVADHVVDRRQPDGRADARVGQPLGRVARLERGPAVAEAADEGVHRVAVRPDLGQFEVAVLVVFDPRRTNAARAAGQRRRVGRRRVVDEPGEVVHPVTVLAHVLGDRRVRLERPRHHEADVTLLQHVARLLPTTGLGPGVPGAAEAERRHQEPGRGAGVAHPELDAVPALQVPGRRVDGRAIGERSVHDVNDAAGAPRLATPRMRVPRISTSPKKEDDGGTT